jgi:hypothetical protein
VNKTWEIQLVITLYMVPCDNLSVFLFRDCARAHIYSIKKVANTIHRDDKLTLTKGTKDKF